MANRDRRTGGRTGRESRGGAVSITAYFLFYHLFSSYTRSSPYSSFLGKSTVEGGRREEERTKKQVILSVRTLVGEREGGQTCLSKGNGRSFVTVCFAFILFFPVTSLVFLRALGSLHTHSCFLLLVGFIFGGPAQELLLFFFSSKCTWNQKGTREKRKP